MQTPSYRIGNDLTILWSITDSAGNPIDLSTSDTHLYMTTMRGREEVEFELVNGVTLDGKDSPKKNILKWLFLGKDQHILGAYTLTFEILDNKRRTIKRDICEAFTLVGKSCEENPLQHSAKNFGGENPLPLSTKLDIYRVQPIVPTFNPDGSINVDGTIFNGIKDAMEAAGLATQDAIKATQDALDAAKLANYNILAVELDQTTGHLVATHGVDGAFDSGSISEDGKLTIIFNYI